MTHRTRADQRLSDLTMAAGVAGLAATIGFGGLAAMTYAGTAAPAANGTGQDSLTVPQTQLGSDPSTTSGSGSTTTRPKTNGTAPQVTTPNGSTGRASRPTGRAHVSTGSS